MQIAKFPAFESAARRIVPGVEIQHRCLIDKIAVLNLPAVVLTAK